MKKKVILIIICLLISPLFVNADMGSPELIEYKAIANNEKGVELYEWVYEDDGEYLKDVAHIEQDEEVTVIYETEFDGVPYSEVELGKNYYYAKSSDLVAKDKVYDIKKSEIGDERVAKILKNNIELKSGPGISYETLTKIPNNITLKINELEEVSGHWYYVEYKGYKGFISDENGALSLNTAKRKTFDKVKVYKDASFKNYIGTIDAEEEVTLYFTNGWDSVCYVKSEKLSGYIKSDRNLTYLSEGKITISDSNIKGYNENDEEVTLPEGEFRLIIAYEEKDYHSYNFVADGIIYYFDYEGDNKNIKAKYKEYDEPVAIKYVENGQYDLDTKNDKEKIKVNDKKGLSTKELIIYGCAAAVLIIVTAGITIALVNRKNNK